MCILECRVALSSFVNNFERFRSRFVNECLRSSSSVTLSVESRFRLKSMLLMITFVDTVGRLFGVVFLVGFRFGGAVVPVRSSLLSIPVDGVGIGSLCGIGLGGVVCDAVGRGVFGVKSSLLFTTVVDGLGEFSTICPLDGICSPVFPLGVKSTLFTMLAFFVGFLVVVVEKTDCGALTSLSLCSVSSFGLVNGSRSVQGSRSIGAISFESHGSRSFCAVSAGRNT